MRFSLPGTNNSNHVITWLRGLAWPKSWLLQLANGHGSGYMSMALADLTMALGGPGYPRFVPDHHGGASLTLAMTGMANSSPGWPGPD